MGPRRVVGLIAGSTALAVAASLWTYDSGVRRGFEQGLGAAASSSDVANGTHALVLLKALDAGNQAEVRRGFDLMIDVGIASHFLHLRVPDALGGEPDEAQQWLYQRLIDHRRQSPSSIPETKYIGPQVAAALANSP